MRRRDAMRILINAFQAADIDNFALDARVLLCAAEEIEHVDLIRDPDKSLDDAACARLNSAFQRRLLHEPVTRILGRRGFWSLDLTITPDVLDPRPDSESLIDASIDFFSDRQHESLHIADLGTGSGALLCALLDVFPAARGVGLDISRKACDVAQSNLGQHGFHGRAEVICGVWSALPADSYDLIVSNPPYIPTQEIETLSAEVREFDPHLALDGGIDGLDAYRQILPIIARSLAPNGLTILEVGHKQVGEVSDIIRNHSLDVLDTRSDHGGNCRVILAIARGKNHVDGQNSTISPHRETKALGVSSKSDYPAVQNRS